MPAGKCRVITRQMQVGLLKAVGFRETASAQTACGIQSSTVGSRGMQLADERTPASHLTWARNKSTTEPVEPKKLSEAEAAAMASQNAGAGSTWNSSQTWEEKEITKWSKQLLREELLPTLTLSLPSEGAALPALPASHEALTAAATAGSLSAELRVTAVEKVDGEATHIISRGKQRVVFEFTLKVRRPNAHALSPPTLCRTPHRRRHTHTHAHTHARAHTSTRTPASAERATGACAAAPAPA